MKVLALALALATASAYVPPSASFTRHSTVTSETKADLATLAKDLNPVVPFYDPLGLANGEFWGESNEASIGWLRHAEIKHGRVAMFAFVGYLVQANGFHWPWKMTTSGLDFPSAGSPPEQWDAIPEAAKWQIIGFVGFLEFWSECVGTHYMRGGRPGEFPSFKGAEAASALPHPVPFDLFDPFQLSKNASPKKKAAGLLAEINNGRLAMVGIMGFLAESKVPGAVPALSAMQGTASEIKPYAGDYMAPFAANFHIFS